MTEPHCPTCICGRRAPVQGEHATPARRDQSARPAKGPGSIAWEEHLIVWSAYAAKWCSDQSAERIAERGGFGWYEIVDLLGREPTTWSPRT